MYISQGVIAENVKLMPYQCLYVYLLKCTVTVCYKPMHDKCCHATYP